MKNNELIIVTLFFCIIAFFVAHFGLKMPQNVIQTDTTYISKTDTLYNTDTFNIIKPKTVYVTKTKTDTLFTKEGKDTMLVSENKVYKDTICAQKDTAIVTSYIQGINAQLDSVTLKLNRREIIKTNTIEITKYVTKPKKFTDRFHIGLGVGYGYGLRNKEFEPFIGVSASIDLK